LLRAQLLIHLLFRIYLFLFSFTFLNERVSKSVPYGHIYTSRANLCEKVRNVNYENRIIVEFLYSSLVTKGLALLFDYVFVGLYAFKFYFFTYIACWFFSAQNFMLLSPFALN
jgi:hypothetical protein